MKNNINNKIVGLNKKPSSITKSDLVHAQEILFITSYPPRECGIATYTHDLITALKNKFGDTFKLSVCALENTFEKFSYPKEVSCVLDTDDEKSYDDLVKIISNNQNIKMVFVQHEFGLFKATETRFLQFLNQIRKPVLVAFHTVLPNPGKELLKTISDIDMTTEGFVVMTEFSAKILIEDYSISPKKIAIIAHGTHLVEYADKNMLKHKYSVDGRKIIATFGLLSAGKSIETTINALRGIVKIHPDVLFLIIGKTHPGVIKREGEKYRNTLEAKINALQLQDNVHFVNQYLPLPELLDYLQLTDIYLFTSNDRNQAVSGTFSYAISCGCPIVSTPIPHAVEVLKDGTGIIIDFENSAQLALEVIKLLDDESLRKSISANGIHKLAPTAWENSAIAHARLFKKVIKNKTELTYKIPEINLKHIKNMTTPMGMIQFSVINRPDITSGYTLDDNARALIAMCRHFNQTGNSTDLKYISIYLDFINHCLQTEGYFLNYVDSNKKFTKQNNENLADSNGRAIWALGYLISISDLLPDRLVNKAKKIMQLTLVNVHKIHSPRAMAFMIKGIYYASRKNNSIESILTLRYLTNKLVEMYKHEKEGKWHWFESYLTYANSSLPEALLCAYLIDGNPLYKEIAKESFDFLVQKTFKDNAIKVISNKGWMYDKGKVYHEPTGGEQPIDVAYSIMALSKFYDVFGDETYLDKMRIAFDWFLGKNHLHQIVYNPCTGGCYDGLEEDYINLNQGAESTVSYLMARLTMTKYGEKAEQKMRKSKKEYKQPIII